MINKLNIPDTSSETECALERKLNEIIDVVNYLSREVAILNAREGHRTLDRFPTDH